MYTAPAGAVSEAIAVTRSQVKRPNSGHHGAVEPMSRDLGDAASATVARYDKMLSKLEYIAATKRKSLLERGADPKTMAQFDKAFEKKRHTVLQQRKKDLEMDMRAVVDV